jgi:predicted DNA-binding ribbon-helix-helix protein
MTREPATGDPAAGDRFLRKRSLSLSGHRTSVALEPEFWAVLDALAARRNTTIAALVAETDAAREPGRPLASALRVLALRGKD